RGTFDRETGICRALPAPCIQAPELLEAPAAPLPAALDQDCAEAQIAGDQEPFVNRGIAALALAMVTRLCQRRLTWRATFFDLDAGTLHYIHADPHAIERFLRAGDHDQAAKRFCERFSERQFPVAYAHTQRGDLIVELAGGIQHEGWGENWQEWGDLWSLKSVFALSWALMEDPYDD